MSEHLSSLTRQEYLALKTVDGARYLQALIDTPQAASFQAADLFTQRHPGSAHVTLVRQHAKAAVTAPVGLPSVMPPAFTSAFVEYIQPHTLIGRLPSVRRVPPQVPVPRSTSAAACAWTGRGKPRPLTAGGFQTETLVLYTTTGIIVLTKPSIKHGAPGTDVFLRNELGRALIAFDDDQFVNPAVTAVADVSPASITNAAPTNASTGSPVSDVRELVGLFLSNGGRLETAVFIMSSSNAVALRLSGDEAFRELTPTGGRLAGVPALASDAVGAQLILLDQSKLLLADSERLDFDVADAATLEMLDSSLQQDATTGQGTSLVSLWQSDLVAIKVERAINWSPAAGAVAVISNFDYINVGSPA